MRVCDVADELHELAGSIIIIIGKPFPADVIVVRRFYHSLRLLPLAFFPFRQPFSLREFGIKFMASAARDRQSTSEMTKTKKITQTR